MLAQQSIKNNFIPLSSTYIQNVLINGDINLLRKILWSQYRNRYMYINYYFNYNSRFCYLGAINETFRAKFIFLKKSEDEKNAIFKNNVFGYFYYF